MPELDRCLINVKTALRVRDLIAEAKFLCLSCGEPVKPNKRSTAGGAHFEHLVINLDCPKCDKRTAKKLYAAYETEKAAWQAKRGQGDFLKVFLAAQKIGSQASL